MSILRLLSSSLLLAVLAVPSNALFAQATPDNNVTANSTQDAALFPDLGADQHWFDLAPQSGSNENQLNVRVDQLQQGQLQPEQFKPPLKFQIQPDDTGIAANQVLGGGCFKIRSYVVARDSKDSDAVHLVRYSTCQPASRYQVKTADIVVTPAQ
jgi:hypothetical protein